MVLVEHTRAQANFHKQQLPSNAHHSKRRITHALLLTVAERTLKAPTPLTTKAHITWCNPQLTVHNSLQNHE
jgi:hypothetical protein